MTGELQEHVVEASLAADAVVMAAAPADFRPLEESTAKIKKTDDGSSPEIRLTQNPDILAGLFIYAFLIIGLGWERNGLAAALALAVTMIPIIARSAEVVLRVVPSGLREASLALGASKWQTVWRVVLPTARSGLATSLILGVARIAGETAPLLIVSSASTYFNGDPFNGPMNSLPLFIISSVRSGQPNSITRGYGAAAVLLLFVLVLFATARYLARDKQSR